MDTKPIPLSDRELTAAAGGYTGPTFVYTVQNGDDLYQLATRYGTTLRVLLELNDFQSASQVRPGVRLLIPQR